MYRNHKSEEGFTAIELVIVFAVIAAVAYLVLPLLFPSDSKTPEQYIEEDLTSISELLTLRQMTAAVNDIKVEDIYIGNLGVYAAKSQVRHSITINTNDQQLTYCLRGDYRGVTRYYESTSGIQTQPTGNMNCPGFEATNEDSTSGETSEPTDNSTAETPAEEPNATEEPNSATQEEPATEPAP